MRSRKFISSQSNEMKSSQTTTTTKRQESWRVNHEKCMTIMRGGWMRWEEVEKRIESRERKVRRKKSKGSGGVSSARLKHDKKFSIISTFILSFRPSSIIFYTFHFSLALTFLLFTVARRSSSILPLRLFFRPMNTFEIQESWETAGGAERTRNGGGKIWMEKRRRSWRLEA